MENKPYIIGLTGGIACGKSTVAEYLEKQGVFVIDADAISHEVTAPGGEALAPIAEAFGQGVFLPDGQLNRRALGELVFSDAGLRRTLEGIIHPLVQRRIVQAIREAGQKGEKAAVLNVPLLFETGMDALCDECWVVSLDRETQIKRLMARDALSASEAEKRIESQMPQDDKLRRANVVIKTGRPIELTHAELNGLLRELKRRLK